MSSPSTAPQEDPAVRLPDGPHEVREGVGRHSLMEIFETPSLREMVRLVLHGLRQPRDSGEYRYATLQLQRLLAPAFAILVPLAAVLILVVSTSLGPPPIAY
jgi:hypothetical protein